MGNFDQSMAKPSQFELFSKLGLQPEKFLAPHHGPRVVATAEEFIHVTCHESHLNQVIVLPDGLKKLGLDVSIPSFVLQCAQRTSSILGFCKELDKQRGLQNFDAYLSRFPHRVETLVSRDKHGDRLEDLLDMYDEARERYPDDQYYISELGNFHKRDHPLTGERSRCLLDADIRDVAEAQLGIKLPIWERGNVFVGEAGTGSCIHVDKVCWSNTGKNWSGFKLFCMWRIGEDTDLVLGKHYKKIIAPPFTCEDIELLSKAVQVCVVQPGDGVVFCGACAHMAVTVGDELNVAGYEALVNWDRESLEIFRETGTDGHLEAEQASRDATDEWKEDAVKRLVEAEKHVKEGRMQQSELDAAVTELLKDSFSSSYHQELTATTRPTKRAKQG